MSSPSGDLLGEPAPKQKWELPTLINTRYSLLALSAIAGAGAATLPALGIELSWLRVLLGVLVCLFSGAAIFLQAKEHGAKTRREDEDRESKVAMAAKATAEADRIRKDAAGEMEKLLSSLARGIGNHSSEDYFAQFLDQCAEKFLMLVGNDHGLLRTAIYRLDLREDDEDPDDDYYLERVTLVSHGWGDPPRDTFEARKTTEKSVVDFVRFDERMEKWGDLTKKAPRNHDPSKEYKAFYTMPVRSPSGRPLGMITCDCKEVGILGDHHDRYLRMFAHLVGIGLGLMKKTASIELIEPTIKRGDWDVR